MGFAEVDVTPKEPIFMAGYAARRKPSEGVDTRLMAQAMAFRSGIRTFVMVSLDNCEVSRAFMRPVLKGIHERLGLETGSVMVVSSHTHSGPILADTLDVMAIMPEKDQAVVKKYSLELQSKLIQVVSEACADLQPARLEKGIGTAPLPSTVVSIGLMASNLEKIPRGRVIGKFRFCESAIWRVTFVPLPSAMPATEPVFPPMAFTKLAENTWPTQESTSGASTLRPFPSI